MKKIILVNLMGLMGLMSLMSLMGIYAQTPTASVSGEVKSASTAASIVEKEIQNLKEKIATKVAELRKKNLKAIAGVVTESSKSTINIKTKSDDDYQVKIDQDLTKLYVISGNQKKELKAADITKNLYIIVSGPVADKTINANVIYRDEEFLVKAGKVTEINTDEDFIRVLTTDKDNLTLDIASSTKIQLLDSKSLEVETARLSKIKEGDTVHFVIKKSGEEKEINRYAADKILIIPQEYFIK